MKRLWSRWPVWSGYAAAIWSFVYGCLGLVWALGGSGFPFGRGYDKEADDVFSLLVSAKPGSTGPIVAVLGLVGTLVGLAMAKGIGRGVVRHVFLAFALVAAVGLALVLQDFRVVMLVTRLPFMPVWAFTGVPGGFTVSDLVPWARVNLLILLVGGLLWGIAALAYARRTRAVCENCGRGVRSGRWTDPAVALKWGRRAVLVAAIVPLIYATTRVSWVLGIPLGIPQSFYDENVDSGMFLGGFAIALMAIGGAILTLAIVPATLVSVILVPAGIMEIRMAFIRGVNSDEWAMTSPGWLWPLWGAALGTATVMYYLRRRSVCRHCGRGTANNNEEKTLETV